MPSILNHSEPPQAVSGLAGKATNSPEPHAGIGIVASPPGRCIQSPAGLRPSGDRSRFES